MASQSPALQPGHTRTYQACIPCRRRKVRCDLGPVDNPHDPPCVRCRRESKECFFSATRRKRKPADSGDGLDDDEISDYEVRNGRKRVRAGPDDASPATAPRQDSLPDSRRSVSATYSTGLPPRPVTPGGSTGRAQPLRRPTGSQSDVKGEDDQNVSNHTTAILQTAEVYSGHDALNLLFEAAGRSGDMEHHRTGSSSSVYRPQYSTSNTAGPSPNFSSPSVNGVRHNGLPYTRSAPEPAVDPAITSPYANGNGNNDNTGFEQAVRAWSRFRFVRAGWFTAREGIAYIDYFYKYLSPLTPIVVPDYCDRASHVTLLTEEPMLVITLLTISARFMSLPGPGGSIRPYAIHDKLWKYLQGMIDRIIWGQEQFGGGFCGAGAQPGSDVNPLSRKGLRTLGTVESLMLLTEWHPRALHFPPGDDEDELMIPDHLMAAMPDSATTLSATGGQRIDSWLEPCWRSDRMCWMLLGNAMSLAYEIGVFDETSEVEFRQDNPGMSDAKTQSYFARKNHLKDLILIYVTQTSGRLGLTSMLPRSYGEATFVKSPDQRLQDRMARLRKSFNVHQNQPLGVSRNINSTLSPQEAVLYFWMEIAAIMESGNQQMFPNRRVTRDLIKSGRYVTLLQYFQPLLRGWRRDFDSCTTIPVHMRHILIIEYEYSRVYLNSLALQAVVERCTHNTPMQAYAQPAGTTPAAVPPRAATYKPDGGAIPLSTIMKWYGNDRYYIAEVIDASRTLLRSVVDGLYPGEFLKHAPVRTYFRIISVAIILLKTFALGATEDDVAISLGLMDRAVEALRTCIVDDVHVANRFSDLLETLTTRIRSRFVRMTATGNPSRGGSPPAPTAPHTPMMPPPQPASAGAAPWSGYANAGAGALETSPAPGTATGRATPSDPLWGISTETYDPGNSNILIMPPPSFGLGGVWDTTSGAGNAFGSDASAGAANYAGSGLADDVTTGGYMPDWLGLPLNPLLDSYGADVNQTTYGPDVGGYDLLDVLLNGMDGAGG